MIPCIKKCIPALSVITQFVIVGDALSQKIPPLSQYGEFPIPVFFSITQFVILGDEALQKIPPLWSATPLVIVNPARTDTSVSPLSNVKPRFRWGCMIVTSGPFSLLTVIALPLKLILRFPSPKYGPSATKTE
jgi:hypothetical protein